MSDLIIKNVCYPRKYVDKNGDEKTNWIKIGTSFENTSTGHHNIEIYTFPVGVKGKLKVSLFGNKNDDNPF